LVREQRGEEKQRPDNAHPYVDGEREPGIVDREDGEGEDPEDQEEDDEPGEVEADLEAEDRADAEIAHSSHGAVRLVGRPRARRGAPGLRTRWSGRAAPGSGPVR